MFTGKNKSDFAKNRCNQVSYAGESILLPATTQDITITPEGGNVKLLETYV